MMCTCSGSNVNVCTLCTFWKVYYDVQMLLYAGTLQIVCFALLCYLHYGRFVPVQAVQLLKKFVCKWLCRWKYVCKTKLCAGVCVQVRNIL